MIDNEDYQPAGRIRFENFIFTKIVSDEKVVVEEESEDEETDNTSPGD